MTMARLWFVSMIVATVAGCVIGYQFNSADKDNLLTDAFLREMAEHMNRDLAAVAAQSYLEAPENGYLGNRVMKALEGEDARLPLDMELEGLSPPSLRDREFLQHSSLWSSQLLGDGVGSGGPTQHLNADDASAAVAAAAAASQMKTDPTLPAYCNPPNPCPVGYSAEDGCLEEFQNTAGFSRKYQSMQECMCDTEHMFDCPIRDDPADYDSAELDNPFINEIPLSGHHKTLVAKKFHTKKSGNPFLEGDKLPIAAKKGQKLY